MHVQSKVLRTGMAIKIHRAADGLSTDLCSQFNCSSLNLENCAFILLCFCSTKPCGFAVLLVSSNIQVLCKGSVRGTCPF